MDCKKYAIVICGDSSDVEIESSSSSSSTNDTHLEKVSCSCHVVISCHTKHLSFLFFSLFLFSLFHFFTFPFLFSLSKD